jgi:hypothetical protein
MNVEPNSMSSQRDHLFISYAFEDIDFAEWLEIKLVGAGFRVWRDGSKLLGGEPYPREIDKAIKERSFRVLAVLSHHSISKPNPTKERTLALNLATTRQESDFLIPLNLEGLSPTELDWMTGDLSFIPFSPSWSEGLSRLLKKLDAVATPKEEQSDSSALTQCLSNARPSAKQERLYSNVFPIRTMPPTILRIRSDSTALSPYFRDIPSIRQADNLLWTLLRPAELPARTQVVSVPWSSFFENVPQEELERKVVRLLRLYIWQSCQEKGLKRAREDDRTYCYFAGAPHKDRRISFRTYSGRRTSLKVTGTRTFRTTSGQRDSCRYHLAPDFYPILSLFGIPALVLRFHLLLTDLAGKQLDPSTAHRRRRRMGKALLNHQWLIRQLAVTEYLSSESETWNLSPANGEPILVSSTPFLSTSMVGINNPRERDLPDELDEEAVLDDSDDPDERDFEV